MTWLKLSDDYSDDCARVELSDAAYRTHTEALNWVMRRETGGRLTHRDVRRFAESENAETAIKELLDAGFWEVTAYGYRVVHHMEHQPEPDLIERRRELTAERVRRHRRKKAGLGVTPLQNALPGSGRDGTGKTPQLEEQEGDWR